MSEAFVLTACGTNIACGAMRSGAALANLFNDGGLGSVVFDLLTLRDITLADMEPLKSVQCSDAQKGATAVPLAAIARAGYAAPCRPPSPPPYLVSP